MQFKTREFLLWIHLHSFDAITITITIFDIINTMGIIKIQIISNGQDQKSTLGLLTGGEKV